MVQSTRERDIDETLPAVVKRFLRGGGQLESIRLDARGKWTHEGLDFENPRIISLFNRSVSRTDGGTWVLQVGRFTYPITVDDTAFFVERVDLGTSPPTLTLSDQTTEPLDPQTLSYADPGKLYCRIKRRTFRARFKRNAYYAIAEHLDEVSGELALVIDGVPYSLSQRTTSL